MMYLPARNKRPAWLSLSLHGTCHGAAEIVALAAFITAIAIIAF